MQILGWGVQSDAYRTRVQINLVYKGCLLQNRKQNQNMSTCIEIRTVQSGAFKVLVEALKDLLTDTSIEFDPEMGMKVVCMDGSHSCLVHLLLEASKFEYFYCKERVCIGINMMQLHKLIRTINNNDTLTMFMDEGDMNHIGIKIENSEKGQKTTYHLNLLDLDHSKISIDPVEFASVITLPSTDFQKIVRDMNVLAEFVEIMNVKNQLIFKCSGDYCTQETIMTDNDTNNHNIQSKDEDEILQGVFSLKYLVLFSKCTNLGNSVQLFLANNYPLILVYQVASLGEIKLALAPQMPQTSQT
jgi:proliferating cell nuclear antigen